MPVARGSGQPGRRFCFVNATPTRGGAFVSIVVAADERRLFVVSMRREPPAHPGCGTPREVSPPDD
eukprot:1627944-Pyramimonas_sp.AAC.2